MFLKRSAAACLFACLLTALAPWGCSKKQTTAPNQAPSIDALSVDGSSVTSDSISVQSSVAAIEVRASDDDQIDRVLINSHAATLSGSSWTWTSQLAAGNNRFIIEVYDEDNLSDIDTIYLNYLSDYPNLYISNFVHATTDTVQSATFTLSGSIKDEDGIEYVQINSSNATLNDTSWTWSTTLSAGSNLLVILAKDSVGLVTTPESIYVYYDNVVPSGLAKISGTLTQAGTGSTAKRLASAKLATNAAGQVMSRVTSVIPVSGADILVYDADTSSTASIARAQTGADGGWEIDSLEPGNYFAFAVYFDVVNRSLITAAISNIAAVADSVVETGEAIAAEDEVKPGVLTILDAASPDSTGQYLASSVPSGHPVLAISFSEPMDRASAKDSILGVVLGPIDTSASTFALADTIPVQKLWNGNNTELRLIPITALDSNKAYGIMVPTSIKDLAFNVLEAKAMCTFTAVAIASIAPFEFAGSSPASGDTVMPTAPLTFNFSRPADLLSVSKNVTIDPVVRGFYEGRGTSISFKPAEALAPGTYTIRIPSKIASLLGDTLTAGATVTFSVRAFSGLAAAGGDTALLSQGVMTCMNAYIAGDLAMFSSFMDADLLVVDRWQGDDGVERVEIKTKEEFIANMKRDAGGDKLLESEGLIFPKYYAKRFYDTSRNDSGYSILNKVRARGDTSRYVFVDPQSMGPFGGPRFYNAQKNEISRDSIRFVPPGPTMEYQGRQYTFAPDFSKMGTVTEDQVKNDPVFYGKLLVETSTIEWARVRMLRKHAFDIQSVQISGDTGYVVQSVVSQRIWAGDSRPWPYVPGVDLGMHSEPDTSAELMAIKLKCIRKSGRWLILRISTNNVTQVEGLASELEMDSLSSAQFDLDAATAFTLPPSVGLISPINKAQGAVNGSGGLTLKWRKADVDSTIGGYLICLAEEPAFAPCRPPKGVMIFVKGANDTTVTVKADGSIDTVGGAKAVAIYKRPFEINANMFPWFEWKLDRVDPLMVFQWSVLAIKDTSASQLLNNSSWTSTIWAQSDFGSAKGYFAVNNFPTFEQVDSICKTQGPQGPPMPQGGGFEDMDRDGVPDGEEIQWGTNPKDPSSKPQFEVDSDGDKVADFLEVRFGTDPQDDSSKPLADSLEAIGFKDSDGDGFPDEVEARMGFNMFDPNNNPGTRVAFEAPVGSFVGKLYYGEPMAITVKMSKDTANAEERAYTLIYTLIKSTGDTTTDTVSAIFDKYMGMTVFLLPFESDGPNAGKSLRMRGNYDGMMGRLGGPVEMVNTTTDLNMVGPNVANWITSNRGEEFEDQAPPMGGTGSGPQGAPMAPPNADSAYLILSENAGVISGKLVYVDNPRDTMESMKAFQGGTPDRPFLEIAFPSGNQIMKFNGNVFPAKPDTLGYFGGIMLQDSMGAPLPFGGGMGFTKADTLPRQMTGTYLGWVFIDTSMSGGSSGPSFGGPPEYIGGVTSLIDNMDRILGVTETDQIMVLNAMNGQLSPVSAWGTKLLPKDSLSQYSFLMPGCVFIVTDSSDTLLVFGSKEDKTLPDAFARENNKILVAGLPPSTGGGMVGPGPGPGGEPNLFKGEAGVAQDALDQYLAAKVMRMDGSSFEVGSITGSTVLAVGDPQRGPMVVAQFEGNNVWYAILASDPTGLSLWVDNGKVVVAQMPDGYQPHTGPIQPPDSGIMPPPDSGFVQPPQNGQMPYQGDPQVVRNLLSQGKTVALVASGSLLPTPVTGVVSNDVSTINVPSIGTVVVIKTYWVLADAMNPGNPMLINQGATIAVTMPK